MKEMRDVPGTSQVGVPGVREKNLSLLARRGKLEAVKKEGEKEVLVNFVLVV